MAIAPSPLLTQQVRNFLGTPRRFAVISTINPDGSPHQAIIWYLLRGDELVINSKIGRRWPANLRRDGRVAFAVEDGDNAVTISGVAEVLATGPDAHDDICEMAVRYDAPDVAQSEMARFRTEDRISFLIRPTKVHVHGDPR